MNKRGHESALDLPIVSKTAHLPNPDSFLNIARVKRNCLHHQHNLTTRKSHAIRYQHYVLHLLHSWKMLPPKSKAPS